MLAVLAASTLLLQGSASTPTAVAVDTMVAVGGYRVHCRIHRGTIPLTIIMETGGAATLASYGGLDSVLADRIAGVVLVDPMNSRFVDSTRDFVYSTVPHITEPRNDRERAIARFVNTFDTLLNAARGAEPKISAPMVVITSSRPMWNNHEREDRAWRASHEAIVAAAPKRRLVVAENSGHQIALDRPDTIIDAVVSLVQTRSR